MSDIPPWKYIRKDIPTPDPNAPSRQIANGEDRNSIPICNVCRQPFNEMEKKIICGECGQYAHVECSNTLDMVPTDNKCIISKTNVDKRSFKYLYGLINGYKESRIKNAGKFSKEELNAAKGKLLRADFLQVKGWLFKRCKVTSKAQELFPVLESIYGKEKDAELFIQQLQVVK